MTIDSATEKDSHVTAGCRWSEEEEDLLISLSSSVPYFAIKHHFRREFPDRSEVAIAAKLRYMGIYDRDIQTADTSDSFDTAALCLIFQRSRAVIDNWQRNRVIKGEKISGSRQLLYSEKEIKRFCVERPDLAMTMDSSWYEYFVGKEKPVIWTSRQISQHLFVPMSTLNTWEDRGILVPWKKLKRAMLYDKKSLEDFLKLPLAERYKHQLNGLLFAKTQQPN